MGASTLSRLKSALLSITSYLVFSYMFLSYFHLQGLQKMTDSLLELAVTACGTPPSSLLLCVMLEKVPNLTSLSLCNMYSSVPTHSRNPSLSAISSLSHLTYLNLNLNAIVNDLVLESIVNGCQQLCSLNLSSKLTLNNTDTFQFSRKIYLG